MTYSKISQGVPGSTKGFFCAWDGLFFTWEALFFTWGSGLRIWMFSELLTLHKGSITFWFEHLWVPLAHWSSSSEGDSSICESRACSSFESIQLTIINSIPTSIIYIFHIYNKKVGKDTNHLNNQLSVSTIFCLQVGHEFLILSQSTKQSSWKACRQLKSKCYSPCFRSYLQTEH